MNLESSPLNDLPASEVPPEVEPGKILDMQGNPVESTGVEDATDPFDEFALDMPAPVEATPERSLPDDPAFDEFALDMPAPAEVQETPVNEVSVDPEESLREIEEAIAVEGIPSAVESQRSMIGSENEIRTINGEEPVKVPKSMLEIENEIRADKGEALLGAENLIDNPPAGQEVQPDLQEAEPKGISLLLERIKLKQDMISQKIDGLYDAARQRGIEQSALVMASPDFLKNMQIGPWEQKKEKKFRTFLKKMLSGVFIKTPKALMTVMRETVEAGKMMAAGKIEEVLPSLMDRLKTRHQKNGEHLEKRKQEGRPVSPDREGLSKQKQEAFEKIILIMQSSNTQTT